MRSDQEKYIRENLNNKSVRQISHELGLNERKVKRFIKMRELSPAKQANLKSALPISPLFSKRWFIILSVMVVAVATALVFMPSLSNNFIEWDDPEYVYENPLIKTLTFVNISKMFTQAFHGAYCPLTILSYAGEYFFFKANPFIYHFTNYCLHIAVTLLIFAFIYLFAKDTIIAFLVALFFGIHPIHVESVAWVAERKDVLYALFYMLALIAYQRFIVRKKTGYYVLCLFFGILSFFAKPMALTLPIILLLLDYTYKRKLDMHTIAEKLPLFAIAGVLGIIGYKFQVMSGVTNVVADNTVRAYFLTKEIPFYLSKLFFPLPLSAVYNFYNLEPHHIKELCFNAAILIALSGGVFFSMRHTKKVAFGCVFFIITILPVLKLIPTGDVFAADRYMYIPSIGIFYLLSLLIKRFVFEKRCGTILRIVLACLLSVWVLFLGLLTVERCSVWKNSETFFLDILKHDPDVNTANNNIGGYYLSHGEYDKAIFHLEKALKNNPSAGLQQMIENNLYMARQKKNALAQ